MSEPRTNQNLSELMAQIAQLLELTGADKFRVIAIDRAARLIEGSAQDLVALGTAEGGREALLEIEGIGPKIADKIIEYARTGRIKEREDLLKEVPPGLLDVLSIPGLGPKTVRAIWDTLGVTDIAGLKRAIEDGSILKVPRMGAKTVQNIKDAMAFAEKSAERTPLGIAMPIAEEIVARLRAVKGVQHADFAGSLRRGRDTIGDLDFLVTSKDPDAARKAFAELPGVEKVLSSGESKSSVRLIAGGRHLQADLRLVPADSYGAALLYFTGSKEFNVRLRELALSHKQTLNEYGLYPLDDDPEPPHRRGLKAVAGKTEASVLKALGVAEVPPELREDRSLEELGKECREGALIELGDIKSELHAHTRASDGAMSIVELATKAKSRGFHTIAVTDHSQSSAIANGLKPDRLLAHIEAVREAAEKVKGITILAGSEVDILADGSLDYEDDLLAKLDIVVASPHASLKQDAKTATARLLKAVTHPLVHIVGHPTGRLVNQREGFFPDIPAIASAAAEHGVALETNANWMRLDLRDSHVRAALEAGRGKGPHGTLIAINCDVHSPEDFENLRYGVLTGRRGGLRAAACVNTWGATELRAWIDSKRGGSGKRKKR